MKIQVKTPKSQFMGYVKKKMDEIVEKAIAFLIEVGRDAYNAQMDTRKSAGVYLSQTGNLQSSIGYSVLYKGKVVFSAGFEPTTEGTEQGATGINEGKAFMQELIQQYQNADLALIFCAGMKYGIYVEKLHNLNVLTTAELVADKRIREVNSILKQLN